MLRVSVNENWQMKLMLLQVVGQYGMNFVMMVVFWLMLQIDSFCSRGGVWRDEKGLDQLVWDWLMLMVNDGCKLSVGNCKVVDLIYIVVMWMMFIVWDYKDGVMILVNMLVNGLFGCQVLVMLMVGSDIFELCWILNLLFVEVLMGWFIGWIGFVFVVMVWFFWLWCMCCEFWWLNCWLMDEVVV